MRVRTYFIVFTVLLALNLLLGQCPSGLPEPWDSWLRWAAGVLSLVCLVLFYRKVMKPFRLIETGMTLLKEQDFGSRLHLVGQHDADRIVHLFNRMMEQLKRERLHVREQNQLFDLIFQASPTGILILDLDGRVASMNPSAVHWLGKPLDELQGRRLDECTFDLCDALRALAMDEVRSVRLNDSGIYRCSCLSFLDNGFRRKFYLIEPLTREVMMAEKKAYEKVIRMIAHEVNNTVAGVASTLDTVDMALEERGGDDELRGAVCVCTDRCYNLSRFITRFADVVKLPDPVLVRSDLNEVVRTNLQFMEAMCAERHITLLSDLAVGPVWVDLDMVLFQQVLINVFKNAAESIGCDGRIVIRTTAGPPVLEVTDNGPGIDKDTASKLFSPFFSTKPNGQGIGLMLVREVLLKHHCTFSLRTGEDGLTRFRICFPTGAC